MILLRCRVARLETVIQTRILYRWTKILGLGLCLLVVAVPSSWAKPSPTAGGADFWYEEALKHYFARDYLDARRAAQIVIAKQRENLPVRILLGRIHMQLGNAASAEKEFNTALSAGADRNLIVPLLAEAWLQQAKFKEIIEDLPLDNLSPQARTKLLLTRGKVYLRKRENGLAREVFEQLADDADAQAEAKIGLARIQISEGNYESAERLIDSALQIDPDNANAWRFKGEARWQQGELDLALQSLDKAIDIEPDHLQARISRAAVLLDLSRPQDALDELEPVLNQVDHDAQAIYLKAQALRALGREKEAQQVLLDASSILKALTESFVWNHPPSLLLLGLIETNQQEYEGASEHLGRYVKLIPHHVGGRKLYGFVLMQSGQYLRAMQMIKPLLDIAPNDAGVRVLMAGLLAKEGQYEASAEMLGEAIKMAPERVEWQKRQALMHLAGGQTETGLAGLEHVLEDQPADNETRLLLAAQYFARKQYQRSAELAAATLDVDEGNLAAMNLLAANAIRNGDLDQAETRLNALLERSPMYTSALLNLGKIAIKRGDLELARDWFEQVLELQPKEPRAVMELAHLDKRQGQLDSAIEHMLSLKANDLLSPRAGAELVELYWQVGDTDAAVRLARDLKVANSENLLVLDVAGRVLSKHGNRKLAVTYFEELARLSEQNGEQRWLLRASKGLYGLRKIEAARAAASAAIRLAPAQGSGYLMAYQLAIADKDLPAALEYAEQLAKLPRFLATGASLKGKVLMRMDRTKEALKSLQAAFQQNPNSLSLRDLYQALYQVGDNSAAVGLLVDWLARSPDDPLVLRLHAAQLIDAKNWEQAETVLRKVLGLDAKDVSALNNLAWVFLQQGKAEALSTAQRARALSPEDPGVLDTLGWILVKQGKPRKALVHLREANTRDATNRQIRYHIAQALFDAGRKSEAKHELREIVKTSDNYPDKQAAQALYKSLK